MMIVVLMVVVVMVVAVAVVVVVPNRQRLRRCVRLIVGPSERTHATTRA